MSSPGEALSATREALVEDDIACLRRLEELGLLDVDADYRPGRMVFRLIAHIPAGYVDADGDLCDKDHWSADLVLEEDYPAKPAAIELPEDQFVPANDCFVARTRGLLSSGTRFDWRPPEALAVASHRAGDCALCFLWTVQPEIMAQILTEHAEVFDSPPLASLPVLPLLRAEADMLMATVRAEEHAAQAPKPPQLERPERKFVIRAAEDYATVSEDPRPIACKPVPHARDTGGQNLLYLGASALQEMFDHIEWGHATERNVHEQGGVLIGLRCRDPGDGGEFVRVTNAMAVHSEQRNAAYVKFDHASWSALLHELDMRKEQGTIPPNALIVGWYHTHPNALDCFMSGTDRITQRSVFHRYWNYALVLNPQRRIIAGFVGAEAEPCALALLE